MTTTKQRTPPVTTAKQRTPSVVTSETQTPSVPRSASGLRSVVTIEKIKADCSLELDDGECSILTFCFQCLGMKTECVLFEPDYVKMSGSSRKITPRKTWELFLKTYDAKVEVELSTTSSRGVVPKVNELIFCDSNGEVSISRKEKETEFIVSKFGAGGDGSMGIYIPNDIAKTLLEKGFKMLVAAKVFEPRSGEQSPVVVEKQHLNKVE